MSKIEVVWSFKDHIVHQMALDAIMLEKNVLGNNIQLMKICDLGEYLYLSIISNKMIQLIISWPFLLHKSIY